MKRRHYKKHTSTISQMTASNIEEIEMQCTEQGEDDDRVRLYDTIRHLTEAERHILCTYAEVRSYRKMAKVLGASATTWRREMARIRNKIIGKTKQH